MEQYFLVTTDHLEDRLWFRDDEDFRVAMNYVAIQAASSPEVAVLAVLPDLYRSLFQKTSFDELNEKEQSELVRQVRFRFSADVTQIARVCVISYAEAANLLDSSSPIYSVRLWSMHAGYSSG